MQDISSYFNGELLYGNNFTIDEIKQWFEEEAEAYANLGSKDKASYNYYYHALNNQHGLYKIKNKKFENALGFGSAYGNEFELFGNNISKITIIEPSEHLRSDDIQGVIPEYVKPSMDGKLPFDDNCFDLITCFGTLHHIPNVSFVFSELLRVLKPGGYLALREPIISMGDWRQNRIGLTKHERGIPEHIYTKEVEKSKARIFSKSYCFTFTSLFQRKIGFMFKKPIFHYPWYIAFDKFISKIFTNNINYHATTKWQRIAPSNIFLLITK